MLGVDPGAPTEEIRAAYRARAQALHPDRRGAGDLEAGAEMAAVNAAWAALRDPTSRAAYDRSLRHSAAAPPRSATSPRTFEPGARWSDSEPPPRFESNPGCLTTLAGVGPWIAVLVVLAVIFVFTAYAANQEDESDPSTSTRVTSVERVRDLRGSCIGLANGATIVVDCFTVPHEGLIVAQASVGAACPEGTVEWTIRQQNVLACTQPGSEAREP